MLQLENQLSELYLEVSKSEMAKCNNKINLNFGGADYYNK